MSFQGCYFELGFVDAGLTPIYYTPKTAMYLSILDAGLFAFVRAKVILKMAKHRNHYHVHGERISPQHMHRWYEEAVQDSLYLCEGYYRKTGLTGVKTGDAPNIECKKQEGVISELFKWNPEFPIPRGANWSDEKNKKWVTR